MPTPPSMNDERIKRNLFHLDIVLFVQFHFEKLGWNVAVFKKILFPNGLLTVYNQICLTTIHILLSVPRLAVWKHS
jgi:hypothetical protein